MRRKRRPRSRPGQIGVFQVRAGQRLGDAAVEVGVGVRLGQRALVDALEIDHVNQPALCERPKQVIVPGGRGVELETNGRARGAATHERLERRLVVGQIGVSAPAMRTIALCDHV